jgi:hypothetical protein
MLELRGIDWVDRLSPVFRKAIRGALVSNPIVGLAFDGCRFPAESFVRMLQSCDGLKSLAIQRCLPLTGSHVEKEEAEHDISQYSIQLDDLRVDDFSWLASAIIVPHINIDFHHIRTLQCDHARYTNDLLKKAGKSLHHFHMKVTPCKPCLSLRYFNVYPPF